ncbi:hypothetical protein MPH_05005 [Macrophomina phaseolina MS6]|uniref:Uncharacterized protein n=1 Tax=Macrophomina phaseolina (strain MS6) TaxID=1126212 RepID=K2R5T6_MACPH|nr:hypothetical protein MPH_05005 [Macrophomina phaseolina MS6]
MQFSKLCLTFGLAIAATLASGMAAAPASQAHAIVMAGNVKDIPVGRDGNSCDADTPRRGRPYTTAPLIRNPNPFCNFFGAFFRN